MTTPYSLSTDSWTVISNAGDTGSCWLAEDQEYLLNDTKAILWHGTTAPDESNIIEGKRIFPSKTNEDVLVFSADNSNDVFYARAINGNGSPVVIVVDIAQ